MVKAGFTLHDVGYARIHRLKTLFNYYKEHPEECKYIQQKKPIQTQSDVKAGPEITVEMIDHPYIIYGERSQPLLKEAFFNEAYLLLPLGIGKIFDVYAVQPNWFLATDRIQIISTLFQWTPTSEIMEHKSEIFIGIQRRRLAAMVGVLHLNFQEMKEAVKRMDIVSKRLFFQRLQELPRDPWGFYTTKRVLSQIGIPHSTYYEILSNEAYGISQINKAKQDDVDVETIRKVLAYKGF